MMSFTEIIFWIYFGEIFNFQICQGAVNLALHKTTSQSSRCWGGDSENAVDGSLESNHLAYYACTHTCESQDNPWWAVDLGASYEIGNVKIKNRSDGGGEPRRLRDVSILVSTSPVLDGSAILCGIFVGPGWHGQYIEVICNPGTVGQYITLTKPTNTLTLCEVEVFEAVTVVPEATEVSGNFIRTRGYKSLLPTLIVSTHRSVFYCVKYCLRIGNECNSFHSQVQSDGVRCELKSGTSVEATQNQIADAQWDHYIRG